MKLNIWFAPVLGLHLCGMGGLTVPVSAAPRVACDSPTFDFGTLNDADTVEHSFTLENCGDEPLTFGQVRACCGATASLRDTRIDPGTNTRFDVRLSLKGRLGPVSKSLYVAINDPRQPHLTLTLTGRVDPSPASLPPITGGVIQVPPGNEIAAASDIVVVPQILTLLLSDPPMPVTRYLALRSRSQTPFQIRGISLPMEAVVKSQTAIGKAGWRIEIGNLVPSGQLEGAKVTFITDRENEPPIAIPVRIAPQQDGKVPPQ